MKYFKALFLKMKIDYGLQIVKSDSELLKCFTLHVMNLKQGSSNLSLEVQSAAEFAWSKIYESLTFLNKLQEMNFFTIFNLLWCTRLGVLFFCNICMIINVILSLCNISILRYVLDQI